MIKALVQNKAGTNVIIEMPCDGYHLSCRPWDRTSRIPPSGLRVSDDNDGGPADLTLSIADGVLTITPKG